MTQWLAGMRITAARLNDFTPIALTTTATPATNFSLSNFSAAKAGGITQFNVNLTFTGATPITAGSTGNIGDTNCVTLPVGCRPASTYYALFDTAGVASGSVRIGSNGVCALTSLDPTASIGSNATVNFSGAFATG